MITLLMIDAHLKYNKLYAIAIDLFAFIINVGYIRKIQQRFLKSSLFHAG